MSDENKETVTITKQAYERLKRAEKKLSCLEDAGVDNWEWYGEAMESFYNDEED